MNDFNYLTTCPYCNKEFQVKEIEQIPGFRFKEDLKCPYCDKVIRTSMEYEFITYKIE